MYKMKHIFADDTKCSHTIRSLEDVEKLQTGINNAAEWSNLSNLPFNETKFIYLRFWAKDTDHPVMSLMVSLSNNYSNTKILV